MFSRKARNNVTAASTTTAAVILDGEAYSRSAYPGWFDGNRSIVLSVWVCTRAALVFLAIHCSGGDYRLNYVVLRGEHMKRLLCIMLFLAFTVAACGETAAPTTTGSTPAAQAATVPTQAPTDTPTQAPAPTPKLAPMPSASDLNQIIDQRDGKATDVNVNKLSDGTTGVAVDIQVNSPTQVRVEHIAYGLAQFFFGSRSDVGAINLAFHADGYTGMDDPIAGFAGVASEYKLGYDESQLWNVMGVFDANLPV